MVVQDDGRASPPIDPVMSILSLSTDSKQVSFGSKGLSPLTQFLNREDTPQEGSMLGTPMPSRDTDMEVCLSLFQRMSSSSDSTNMVMMSSEDIHLPERGIFLRDTFAFSVRPYLSSSQYKLLSFSIFSHTLCDACVYRSDRSAANEPVSRRSPTKATSKSLKTYCRSSTIRAVARTGKSKRTTESHPCKPIILP